MKTRAQSKETRHHPYRKKVQNKCDQDTIIETLPRLFLVTECGGTNGWVVQAESPFDGLVYFQQEILQTRSQPQIHEDLQTNWTQYLQLETNPS